MRAYVVPQARDYEAQGAPELHKNRLTAIMSQLLTRVLKFIRTHRLFQGGDRVLVAFSGGPDSVALALILRELMAETGAPGRLVLAHLNHRLRGDESDRDETFCRRFAEQHDMPIEVSRMDVARIAEEQGGSLEEVARRLRYGFLRRTARDAGVRIVATGHQADDVAETVLLRLLRGASMQGLGALAPARPLGEGVRLVRPLLQVRRSELLRYLESRQQPYCVDSSNQDTAFTRNRIRQKLIPALERDFPTFSVESLCALNQSALESRAALEKLAEKLWASARRESHDTGVALSAAALAEAPPAVRKGVARLALQELTGRKPDLRTEHYEALAALPDQDVGAELDLPGGLLARREQGIVYFAPRGEATALPPRRLEIPGSVELPEANIRIECEESPEAFTPAQATLNASRWQVYVSRESLAPPLTVRSRRPGDVFHPLGAPGSVKLKDFFINSKVARHRRDTIPLVIDARGNIVWVVGRRIAEGVRLPDGGTRAVKLRASPMD